MFLTVFLKDRWIAFLLLAAVGCKATTKERSLPYFNTPDFTPVFLASSGEKNTKITHTIAPFVFENQDGKLISNKDVDGRIHVANFIFTSCGSICPKMTNSMNTVSNAFAKDDNLVLLSFSVTPWIDTKDVLKRYKERNNISNPNWHFLTGEKADIYKLARQSYFAEEDIGFTNDSSEFLHTEHFILVDKSQRIRGIYNGTLELDIQNLIKDIRVLKKEED
jgi:protein SCO1/2